MRILLFLCLVLSALCSNVQQHIIGGSDASISDYPYSLSLRVTGSHSCGASLIGSTRAVTAAHCSGSAIGLYTILGGTSDRTVTNCATCVLTDLNMIRLHPNYDGNGNGYPNDVAVLGFLAVSFNSNFQPIFLSTPSDGSYSGATCTITGWGKTSSVSGLPVTLQMAQVTVLTNAECAAIWGIGYINDGHICLSDSNSAACNGDSGGPLDCNNELAGLSSWGHTTCSPSYPSVYTRMSYYYSWIINQ